MTLRLALALALLAGGALADGVPEPEGYRTEEYRAPVPETLAGATVLDLGAAHALWEAGAAFVDVLPRTPKPEKLPEGTVWHDKPRDSIPGAIWLPNTGYGALAPAEEAYLAAGLANVTEGDKAHPVVFFCLSDCWMSWNAAKRALTMGYTAVNWMPEGTDGWQAAGYPLERLEPEPQ